MKSLYANGTKAWCLPLQLQFEPAPIECVIRGFSVTQVLVDHPEFDAPVKVDEDHVFFSFAKAQSSIGLKVMLNATRLLDRQLACYEPGTAVWLLPQPGTIDTPPLRAELVEHEHTSATVKHDFSTVSVRFPAERVYFSERYAIDATSIQRRLAMLIDEDRAEAALAIEHCAPTSEVSP